MYLPITLEPRSLRYQPSSHYAFCDFGLCPKVSKKLRSLQVVLRSQSARLLREQTSQPRWVSRLRRIFASTSCGLGSRVTNSTTAVLDFDPYTLYLVHGRITPKGNYVLFRTLLRAFCILGNFCCFVLVRHYCYFQLLRRRHPRMRNVPLPV